jgi:hypothetical protein
MWLGFYSEEHLVKKVVEAIWNALPSLMPLQVAQYPVGLEKTSMDVLSMLYNKKRVIGICGMGGIGKTTLAKEVYNQVKSRYESCCFLDNVKDANSMDSLRLKMVMNLIGKDATYMVGNYDRCFERIQKKKVLVVVDDISEAKQFYELIPHLNRLLSGSEVIITSRDRNLLNTIMASVALDEGAIYDMPVLNFPNSMELFLNHAFRKRSLFEVDVAFHGNVKDIVNACKGLPLALEVIGGSLFNKKDEPKCWTEAIVRIRKDKDIIKSLRISFDDLANEEKDMFIDIACTMLGHSKDMALEFWNSIDFDMPNWSLNALVAKSLVKVDSDGHLQMHDLLRDMGREIVLDKASRNVRKQSHIWDCSKILTAGLVRFLRFFCN